MMQKNIISINDRVTIGGNKTFIISEIGSNHNSDLSIAIESIDASVDSGADAVKFQSINLDELYFNPLSDTRELHKQIDLDERWYFDLQAHSQKKGIVFFSSPTYLKAVDILEEIEVPLYKLASAQVGTFPQIIERVANTGKPAILSTGIASYGELEKAIQIFRKCGNDKFVVLHCNSIYPTPYDKAHLPLMHVYREMFDCPVGYSDHTEDIYISLAAVALGAEVIEKHFILSKRLDTPDAPFSLDTDEFTRLVNGIRAIEQATTFASRIEIEEEEQSFKTAIRYRLFLNRDKSKGESFSAQDFEYKRYEQGIDCSHEKAVITHMTAKQAIPANIILQWDMLEGQ